MKEIFLIILFSLSVASEILAAAELELFFGGESNVVVQARDINALEKHVLQSCSNLVSNEWSDVGEVISMTTSNGWLLATDEEACFFRLAEAVPDAADLLQLQEQLTAYWGLVPPGDAEVAAWMSEQIADGSWPDIDYTSTVPGNWPTKLHLKRMRDLAKAYVSDTSAYQGDASLRTVILDALDFWLDNDFRNSNWFNDAIGIPEPIAYTILLMDEDMPQDLIDRAMSTVLSDSRTGFGRTGQNKIWKAGIELMKGWIRDDLDHVEQAADEIWSELVVTTGEGLQPDWSFYQHGNMFQMGNYGLSFAQSEVLWAYTLAGTYYAVDEARKGLLRNFLLEGHAWVLWQDMYDLSACGRQIDVGNQASKGRLARELLNRMAVADSNYQTEYDAALQLPGGVTGSKVFWRSDYAMHRMTNWYASVRMCSIRIEGGEDTNYENMLGLHQSDGVLLVHQNGDEYRDIAGLWNWRRPPGVTTDQGISNLRPTDAQMQGRTSFVGGLGDGVYGVCAQDYRRDSLYARQAWFMEEDAIVCLGAGIDGVSISNVCTSVEQSMRLGTVTGSVGAVSNGTTTFPAGSWVHQGNVGYYIEQPFTVHSDTVIGNWQDVFWDRGDRPVTGEVFSVWIDHGVSPAAQSYAYTVYPQTAATEMPDRIANDTSAVLSNTTALQAVENNGGVHAVFYAAGQVVSSAGQTIAVSHPCVVSLRGTTLYVCDPTQSLSSLTVTIDGNPVPVSLPSGGYAGQQVEVDLAL